MSVVDSAVQNHLPVPVSFRSLDVRYKFVDYATDLVGVFQNGVVITSPKKLYLGALLSIRMRMQPETPRGAVWYRHCLGRVIAEQRVNGGSLGYKIEFESMDIGLTFSSVRY